MHAAKAPWRHCPYPGLPHEAATSGDSRVQGRTGTPPRKQVHYDQEDQVELHLELHPTKQWYVYMITSCI